MTENEQKQITELSGLFETICWDTPDEISEHCSISCSDCKAKYLYSKGYRKVERGEWKKTCVPDVFQCTNCKRPTKMDMLCDSEILRPFCPNCGADMRGEKNESVVGTR